MPKYLGNVRCWVNSGKHLLSLSFSGFDPKRTWTRDGVNAMLLMLILNNGYFYFRPMTFGHLFLRLKLSPLAMEFWWRTFLTRPLASGRTETTFGSVLLTRDKRLQPVCMVAGQQPCFSGQSWAMQSIKVVPRRWQFILSRQSHQEARSKSARKISAVVAPCRFGKPKFK